MLHDRHHAAAQLDLYRDHPGEEDIGARRHEESIGIYGAKRNRHEAEHDAEGTGFDVFRIRLICQAGKEAVASFLTTG